MSQQAVTGGSEWVRTGDAGRSQHAPRHRVILNVAAALIFAGGLIAATTGAWFIVGEHPFHRAGGFAKEFGMTRAQVDGFNHEISDWVIHVSDQVGAVSLGWGLFLMTLAASGVRHGQRSAWLALWLGGTPTLVFAAFGELSAFGTLDTGSILSIVVLLLFLMGMLLPARVFLARAERE